MKKKPASVKIPNDIKIKLNIYKKKLSIEAGKRINRMQEGKKDFKMGIINWDQYKKILDENSRPLKVRSNINISLSNKDKAKIRKDVRDEYALKEKKDTAKMYSGLLKGGVITKKEYQELMADLNKS